MAAIESVSMLEADAAVVSTESIEPLNYTI
jgi:hypothetical protein